MEVYDEILELESLCRDLGIPEYTENLTADSSCKGYYWRAYLEY